MGVHVTRLGRFIWKQTMGDKTGIQWTDATWNFVRGCKRVSRGCQNCYAEVVAHRFSGPGQPFEGLTVIGDKGPRWNNTVKLLPERLDQPLRWTKQRMIFVNSVSDLFHKKIPFEFIAASFGVMAEAKLHTFQILTKRPGRADMFFRWLVSESKKRGTTILDLCLEEASKVTKRPKMAESQKPSWPLPNVWLGVSAEDQITANQRIPTLLTLPSAIHWVSYEPALEAVDFSPWINQVNWIVVGGESGSKARPFHWRWAEDVVTTCKNTNTKVFVKQMGSEPTMPKGFTLQSSKGGELSEWPKTIQVREYPK